MTIIWCAIGIIVFIVAIAILSLCGAGAVDDDDDIGPPSTVSECAP